MPGLHYHYAKEESECVRCGRKIPVGARVWTKPVSSGNKGIGLERDICNLCGGAELTAEINRRCQGLTIS